MNRNQALSIVQSSDIRYISSHFKELIEIAESDTDLLAILLDKLSFRLTCLFEGYVRPFKDYRNLYLSGHRLNLLPSSVWQLQQLGRLDYMEGFLTEVPKEIANLSNLHTLYSSFNRINKVAPELGSLKKLTHLWLNDNRLVELPQALSKLTQLEELCLDNNGFRMMPSFIGSLKNLKQLRITGNLITEIPEFIYELENLESLSLGGNRIATISKKIGKLTKLHYLGLQNNPITKLPEEFNNLNVHTLNLRNTAISNFSILNERLEKARI
jgi:Leucine-rich repeat (LRR) protein